MTIAAKWFGSISGPPCVKDANRESLVFRIPMNIWGESLCGCGRFDGRRRLACGKAVSRRDPRALAWNKKVREEGVVVVVPQDAEQALLFLAPETGGDFSTLRSSVRGKPGVFVRASQDLNQANLDRSRLDQYINAVKQTSDIDPKALHDRSVLLARSLTIKLDEQCFDKPVEQQISCLTQHSDQLVLDDGHRQSMVAALTSGASSDLIGQLSNTRLGGGRLL
jgi:hypothetical protein